MGLGACSYPSIRKQAIVENTSKEIILYSINNQDNYALVNTRMQDNYALVHTRMQDTVKPPNKGHFGDRPFVPCREVVLFSEVLF